MSSEITKLSPNVLWKSFYKLTQIPRPSKSEKEVQQFMLSFGKKLNLETEIDSVGNVLIRKPATPGMESRKGVILQGHLDMVPQKNSSSSHDFENDPIDAYIDGEWVTARGTTLGADNGVGVAAAMAVLASNDIEHGDVEGLFTCDEETGMTGAFGLKPNWLKGNILLNLDSEDEGELYVGCAGGINANIEFKYKESDVPDNVVPVKLILSGLKGGHSGLDIDKGKGNANKLLIRFLNHASESIGARLASFSGGGMRNAIPREGEAVVVVPGKSVEKLENSIKKYEAIYKAELGVVEPDLSFTMEETEMPSSLIEERVQNRLISSLNTCPNGAIRMSDTMPGLVETSTNLSSVKSEAGTIKIQCLLRSSVETAKKYLAERISSVFSLANASVTFDGDYPGWKPNMESSILNQMQSVYNEMYGKTPKVLGIHAGLECGILGSLYPDWDMISFGPTIRYPHSPDEKVHIESVDKFWRFLLATLKSVPAK